MFFERSLLRPFRQSFCYLFYTIVCICIFLVIYIYMYIYIYIYILSQLQCEYKNRDCVVLKSSQSPADRFLYLCEQGVAG
jgi:hypothetical protein